MAYIQTANRTIELSPNVAAADLQKRARGNSRASECFSSRFAYSEAEKVWPIYRRRIVPSNCRLMWLRLTCRREHGETVVLQNALNINKLHI